MSPGGSICVTATGGGGRVSLQYCVGKLLLAQYLSAKSLPRAENLRHYTWTYTDTQQKNDTSLSQVSHRILAIATTLLCPAWFGRWREGGRRRIVREGEHGNMRLVSLYIIYQRHYNEARFWSECLTAHACRRPPQESFRMHVVVAGRGALLLSICSTLFCVLVYVLHHRRRSRCRCRCTPPHPICEYVK